MSDRFESLSKKLAVPMPRRRALRVMGATVAAAAGAAVIGTRRGDADGGVCAAGEQACGPTCCTKGHFCGFQDASTGCCCPKGSTPCGKSCCTKGVACLSAQQEVCGCQAGTTPCGDASNITCCPAGTACTSGCPSPSGTYAPGVCIHAASDVNVKEHIVPVRWEGG